MSVSRCCACVCGWLWACLGWWKSGGLRSPDFEKSAIKRSARSDVECLCAQQQRSIQQLKSSKARPFDRPSIHVSARFLCVSAGSLDFLTYHSANVKPQPALPCRRALKPQTIFHPHGETTKTITTTALFHQLLFKFWQTVSQSSALSLSLPSPALQLAVLERQVEGDVADDDEGEELAQVPPAVLVLEGAEELLGGVGGYCG